MIQCSGCGAPVDLAHDIACRYCRAHRAILDSEAVARTLRELDAAAARRAEVLGPEAAAAAVMEGVRFDRAVAIEDRMDMRTGVDLIGVGLTVLAALISR